MVGGHVRKLLYAKTWPPLSSIYPPPSPLIYKGLKENHDLSPFLIPLFVALGAGFVIVAYFTIVKKYYLSSNNRTQQNLDDDRHGSVHENHDSAIFHPIWLINTIGLEQSVIDSILQFKYKKNEGLIEGAVCSICLSDFEEDETLRLLPKCSHAFHVSCIDTWLRSQKNCPTCRALIFSEPVVNTQTNELESNSDTLRLIQETSDEDLSNFDEADDLQVGSEMGTGSENFSELTKEKGEGELILMKKLQCLGTKSCDFRVFSDSGEYRDKVKAESEPVRRSISMDPSYASMIYHAMANIHETEAEGSSSTYKAVKSEKSDKGLNVNSRLSKMMNSSSLRFSFRKGPISLKRSSSSSAT